MEVVKINIFIQDNFVASNDFSPDDILAYLTLRKLMKKDCNEYFVSIGLLSYELANKQVLHRTITASLLSGISELLSKEYITQVDDQLLTRKDNWIMDLSKLYIDTRHNDEYYSVVNSDHILKLVNSDLKEKLTLIKFYCYVMTTATKTGAKGGVGFTSYVDMAAEFGSCRQTISKYMTTLEEYRILYVYKSKYALLNGDGGIQEISNTYGDIANKDKIISVGKQYEELYGSDKNRVVSGKKSSSRSASVRYSYIQKDIAARREIRYSYDELKDIYETLLSHNKRYEHEEGVQKNLSIFKEYDFYESK